MFLCLLILAFTGLNEMTGSVGDVSAIDPGHMAEGDCLTNTTYSPDGSRIFVANTFSQNITVFDPVTMQIKTTFPVNGSPENLLCSDKYLILLMAAEHSIQIYKLSDYSMVASFDVSGIPASIKIDASNRYAYVACYLTPEYNKRECKVIDLNTLTCVRTLDNFPVRHRSIDISLETNRIYNGYTQFEILPDGKHIAMGAGYTKNSLVFINTATGNIDTRLPVKMCEAVGMSGDGKYLVAWDGFDPARLIRVNLSTLKIETTVTVPGHARNYSCLDIAVNSDGSKALVSTTSNTAHMIRFNTGDYVKFDRSTTGSPSWIRVTDDHSTVICGGLRTAVVDFESEKVLDHYKGNPQQIGSLSPTANNFVAIFPYDIEKVQFYSFTNSSLEYRGSTFSGSPIEGDGSRRVTVSPDGSIALISNTLSNNISIMNMNTHEVDAIIELSSGRTQDAAITSDSRWAIVCGGTSNKAHIIDLEKRTIAATVSTGKWCNTVALTPDDKFAYVANTTGGTVSVIKLDGTASARVSNISCPGQYYVSEINAVYSGIAISPDGTCCLLASSKEDIVRVIDTATNAVVANLHVGSFPIQLAFNDDGSRAIVSNAKSSSYSLLEIDGASSAVIKTEDIGSYPIKVAYNPTSDLFAVAVYKGKKIVTVNPTSGAVEDAYNYPGNVIDLDFTSTGDRIALIENTSTEPAKMYIQEDHVSLNYRPCDLEYSNAGNAVVAVSPGPDMIFHVKYDNTGIFQNEICTGNLPGLSISPNPGADHFAFNVVLPSECTVNLAVYDLNGRLVADVREDSFAKGNYTFSWDTELPAGIYALKLDAGEKTVSRLFTVCR